MPCRRWACLGVLLVVGCAAPAVGTVDTGSRQAAVGFFEAVLRRDWHAAYALLDADSRAKCSEDHFTTRAQAYLRRLGFEPQGVAVQACEEHGNTALAHLVLTGSDGKKHRRFREGAELRKTADGWAVVLPRAFNLAALR